MSTKIHGENIFSYHGRDAVSSTKLAVFHDSPTEYFQTFVTKTMPPKSSWAFDFGQAFHCAMESPAALSQHTVAMQFPDFRTDKAKAWRAEMHKERKLILTADELKAIGKMKARVEAEPIAAQLLADTESEVTWRRAFGKYTVQCRTDRWGDKPREIRIPNRATPLLLDRWFVDFKTTTSLAQFRKSWINFGYARQKVFYQEVILSCQSADASPGIDIPRAEAFWVVSETEPPHDCRVFSLGPDTRNVARAEVMMDLKMLARCYDTGNWSAPAEIESLEYPRWAVEQAERRLLEQKARLELAP